MESNVVSVRLGVSGISKASVWAARPSVKVKANRLSIEDPFNLHHDLGSSLRAVCPSRFPRGTVW